MLFRAMGDGHPVTAGIVAMLLIAVSYAGMGADVPADPAPPAVGIEIEAERDCEVDTTVERLQQAHRAELTT